MTAFWQRRWVRSCCLRAVNVSFNGTAFHFWFTVRFVLFVVHSFSLPFGWRFVPTSRHVSFMAPFHVWTAISPPCFCHYSGDLQASRFCHLHCLAPKTAIMHFLCCPYVSFAMLYFSPFSLLSLIRPASTFFFLQLVFLLQLSDCCCCCFVSRVAHCRLANTHMFNAPVHLLCFAFSVFCICHLKMLFVGQTGFWWWYNCCVDPSHDEFPWGSLKKRRAFFLFLFDASFVYCFFVFPLTPVFFEGRILRML